MTEALGQQVVVDNRADGNGKIGMKIAARAAPDGHTWMLATAGQLTVQSRHVQKVTLRYCARFFFHLRMREPAEHPRIGNLKTFFTVRNSIAGPPKRSIARCLVKISLSRWLVEPFIVPKSSLTYAA